MKSAIYFLIDRKTIVYIGQTQRFPCRFNMVNAEFVFDRIRMIECPKNKLSYYELRWIDRFRPKYNIVGNKDKIHPLLGKPVGIKTDQREDQIADFSELMTKMVLKKILYISYLEFEVRINS